jgi:hypothetical protein
LSNENNNLRMACREVVAFRNMWRNVSLVSRGALGGDLVRTQKFSEKAKAPPTLIENRELGLFFMEEQLLCDQWSNGGFAGRQLLDIATQRKPTQVFSAIFIASR